LARDEPDVRFAWAGHPRNMRRRRFLQATAAAVMTLQIVPRHVLGQGQTPPSEKLNQWRAWFDFGTGALGDMAIHNLDPAFYALDLGAPSAAECESSPLGRETYPAWQVLTHSAGSGQPGRLIAFEIGGEGPGVQFRAGASGR
jgi:hypothetical protein